MNSDFYEPQPAVIDLLMGVVKVGGGWTSQLKTISEVEWVKNGHGINVLK